MERQVQKNSSENIEYVPQAGNHKNSQQKSLVGSKVQQSELKQGDRHQSEEYCFQDLPNDEQQRFNEISSSHNGQQNIPYHDMEALKQGMNQVQGSSIQQEQKSNQNKELPILDKQKFSRNSNKQESPSQSKKKLPQQSKERLPSQSKDDLPSSQRFQNYLIEAIIKMGESQTPTEIRRRQAMQSPMSFINNFSLRSLDSPNYHPKDYSLNLDRSYIPNFLSLGNPKVYEHTSPQTKEGIESKLKFIYSYYAETYLQPTKNYQNFDVVKERIMNFQSFCLFAKDFKLLKTIFKLNTIKNVFKKQSQFGKVLQFKNFVDLIEALSHEKESNSYFNLQQAVPGMNAETRSSLELLELYAYLGLNEEQEKIKQKFSKVFYPFNCQQDAQLPKKKFNYRKLSLPDLHKKALPELKQNKTVKSQIKVKSIEKLNHSSFDNQKQVLVSWKLLKSHSTQNLESMKNSAEKVKKLIKQDPQDKIYLNEYKQIKSVPRNLIEKKIKQIKQIQEKKSHLMIENLKKIDQKIISSKLNMQKILKNKL